MKLDFSPRLASASSTYALSLERDPNFDAAHIFRAYQVGNGGATDCTLLDPAKGGFTTLAMRRRIDHRWIKVAEIEPLLYV